MDPDKLVELVEKICEVLDLASALNIDIKKSADEMNREIMRASNKAHRTEVKKIIECFRSARSTAIQ